MPAYVFLCDMSTEQECLDRKLLGTNPGDAHRFHYSKIVPGDVLYLYNFETGFMRGPFKATTPCKQNIDPAAWRKAKRNFPWQVRVDDSGVGPKPLTADELPRYIPLTPARIGLVPPYELTDEQSAKLLAVFAAKNPAT